MILFQWVRKFRFCFKKQFKIRSSRLLHYWWALRE